MGKQKVIVVTESAIIQKGLADILLHSCDVAVSQFVSDYQEAPLISRLKKSILFLDLHFVAHQPVDLNALKRNGNAVYLLALDAGVEPPDGSFDGMFLLYEGMQAIQKKLAVIFPKQPKSTDDQAELTQRETEVLKLVARGSSNKEIADELSISLHTVISHRKNICRKLEIKTIPGLTLYALINNLIS
jgi:DNA-binding CsgD family transcriptional regulator